jgi:hypothetical protein
LNEPGHHAVRAEIVHTDDLPLDDAATLMVEVTERIPILLVESSREARSLLGDLGYLKAAIGGPANAASRRRTVFEPRSITYAELTAEAMRDVHCIVLANVPEMAPPLTAALEHAVRDGVGLWIVPGEDSDPAAFNAALFHEGHGLSPLPMGQMVGISGDEESFERISPPAANHPATRWLADTHRLDIDRVQIFRRFALESDDAPAESARTSSILLATGEGMPLAAEKAYGRSRAICRGRPSWPECAP